jgi:hypothetical protein
MEHERVLQEQQDAREKDHEEERLARLSLEERDKELKILVESVLGEVQSACSELEETAQVVQSKEGRIVELEAQVQETEQLKEEKRRVLEELKETEDTISSLKGELEDEKGRCITLQELVEQQERDLSASRAPKPTSDAATCTEAAEILTISEEESESSGTVTSLSVENQDGVPSVSAHNCAMHVPLPSVAEVWARLIPVSNAPKGEAGTSSEAGGQGAHLFPGPSGTDIVIKPKGASSWQVVRPPLESAEDAIERERMLVQRTLGVVEQLYQHRVKQKKEEDARTASGKDKSSQADKENGGVNSCPDASWPQQRIGGTGTGTLAEEMSIPGASPNTQAARQPAGGRDGAAPSSGSLTPFKSESVLQRLSELRSCIHRSAPR